MDVDYINVRGHVEVFIDGKFFCSADTLNEAIREVERSLI